MILDWLGKQKNNIKSIDDFTYDTTKKIIGLKKDGYMFYFNIDGTEVEVYIINYVLNGGTNEENATTSYSGGETIRLPVPIKEGAQFIGWSITEGDSKNTILNITPDMEGDLTLYACWINELPEDYFKYNTNGTGIIGFEQKGADEYANVQEMDLIFPSKHNDVTITSISGFNGKSKIKKLVIPDTVTTIANNTFSGCTGIEYIKIPISTAITGNVTFSSVSNVKEVYFSKGTGIGATYDGNSYKNTPWYLSRANLTKITLEKGITSIGNHAFRDCYNIDIKWEDIINNREELTSIGGYAFCNCTKIKGELEFPSKITSIYTGTFISCTGIERLIIPDTITTLQNNTFRLCTGIKYIKIPISLHAGGNEMFSGAENIEEVCLSKGTGVGATYDGNNYKYTPWYISRGKSTKLSLERGITSIGSYTFRDCNKLVANWEDIINNREELTSIGGYAFCACTNIKGELEFPSKITSVYTGTFIYCYGIERLIIPDTITTIQNNTFRQCTGINYLKIPISLAANGNEMFTGAENIEEVYFSKGSGTGATYDNGTKSYTPWYLSRAKFTKLTLEKGITSIGNYTLKDCNNISTIKFTGTSTEWNSVNIGSNNSILSTITVQCKD